MLGDNTTLQGLRARQSNGRNRRTSLANNTPPQLTFSLLIPIRQATPTTRTTMFFKNPLENKYFVLNLKKFQKNHLRIFFPATNGGGGTARVGDTDGNDGSTTSTHDTQSVRQRAHMAEEGAPRGPWPA